MLEITKTRFFLKSLGLQLGLGSAHLNLPPKGRQSKAEEQRTAASQFSFTGMNGQVVLQSQKKEKCITPANKWCVVCVCVGGGVGWLVGMTSMHAL